MTPEHTATALAAALPALRLNRAYLDWRSVQAHLHALAIACPDQPLALLPGTAWPRGEDWVRVRVDHGLARDVLPTLPSGGGRALARQRAYLAALLATAPLPPTHTRALLVERLPQHVRIEVIHNAHDLALPRLSRITVRMAAPLGPHVSLSGDTPSLSDTLARTIAALPDAPAAQTAALARLGTVELVTIGTIGPARTGLTGPWLSAVLTRIGPELRSSRVDDPLRDDITLPSPDRPERMSHIRKWAVPTADKAAAKQWLADQGSRNLVYTYSLPAA